MERTNDINTEQGNDSSRVLPPGLVMADFNVTFLDTERCNKYLLDRLHDRGPHCPLCKETLQDERPIRRYYALMKFSCKSCGARSSAKKGTILENTSMSSEIYILLSLFLVWGFSTPMIVDLTGMSDESVRQWRVKLNVER